MSPRRLFPAIPLLAISLWTAADPLRADGPGLEAEIARHPLDGLVRTAVGVTRQDTSIPAFLDPADLKAAVKTPRVLLVGGLDGSADSVRAVMSGLSEARTSAAISSALALSSRPITSPSSMAEGAQAQSPRQ